MTITGVSDELGKLIDSIVNMFYLDTHLTPIQGTIIFTTNIYYEKLNLTLNEKMQAHIINNKDFYSSLNGTIVLPNSITDPVYLLISNHTIDEQYTFIGTLIHELTHIHDYHDYCTHMKLDSYPDNYHNNFMLWTEYHARRFGYSYLRKITLLMNQNLTTEYYINYIKTTECPFQLDYLNQQLIKYQNEPYFFLYNIMQFLGRYSVWQDYYPDDINQNTIPYELIDVFDKRIINLYIFLYTHNTFDIFIDSIYELTPLLEAFCINE